MENTSDEVKENFSRLGYIWRKDYTDADGFIKNPRLGFYWR